MFDFHFLLSFISLFLPPSVHPPSNFPYLLFTKFFLIPLESLLSNACSISFSISRSNPVSLSVSLNLSFLLACLRDRVGSDPMVDSGRDVRCEVRGDSHEHGLYCQLVSAYWTDIQNTDTIFTQSFIIHQSDYPYSYWCGLYMQPINQ